MSRATASDVFSRTVSHEKLRERRRRRAEGRVSSTTGWAIGEAGPAPRGGRPAVCMMDGSEAAATDDAGPLALLPHSYSENLEQSEAAAETSTICSPLLLLGTADEQRESRWNADTLVSTALLSVEDCCIADDCDLKEPLPRKRGDTSPFDSAAAISASKVASDCASDGLRRGFVEASPQVLRSGCSAFRKSRRCGSSSIASRSLAARSPMILAGSVSGAPAPRGLTQAGT